MIRDNIHYNFKRIDGYNKPINLVIAGRDPGKTTALELDKAYKYFKQGFTTLILARKIADITQGAIQTFADDINEFTGDNIEIKYKEDERKTGIVPLYIDGKQFGIYLALSAPINRIKKVKLKNIWGIIFDEFILDPKNGETYLQNEFFKFQEIYTTFKKNYTGKGFLKVYLTGNPYTLYNPYFLGLGVPIEKLHAGVMLSGDIWAVECYKVSDELFNFIKSKNPFYIRDSEYSAFALNGQNINDNGIKISSLPNNFKLFIVCEVMGRFIGIFKSAIENIYHCQPVTYDNLSKEIYCFNIEDLLNGNNILYSPADNMKFISFRLAYRRNKITYSDIATYYDVREIYNYI